MVKERVKVVIVRRGRNAATFVMLTALFVMVSVMSGIIHPDTVENYQLTWKAMDRPEQDLACAVALVSGILGWLLGESGGAE